jgi:hypothetical protein
MSDPPRPKVPTDAASSERAALEAMLAEEEAHGQLLDAERASVRARVEVRHQDVRRGAEVLEGAHRGSDEVAELLRPRRLGVRVVARAEHEDVELDLDDLAAPRVDRRRLLARVVDEALLAGPVHLAHRDGELLPPRRVEIAKLAVLVRPPSGPARCRTLLVLGPEKLQRDARPAKLAMDLLEVDRHPGGRLVAAELAKEARFHLRLAQGRGLRPGQSRRVSTSQVVAHRGRTHRTRDGDLAQRTAAFVTLPQSLPHFSHRQSRRHGAGVARFRARSKRDLATTARRIAPSDRALRRLIVCPGMVIGCSGTKLSR